MTDSQKLAMTMAAVAAIGGLLVEKKILTQAELDKRMEEAFKELPK